MNEKSTLSVDDIKRKAIVGVFALTTRSYVMAAISAVGTIILTIILGKADFGIFILASSAINFLNYFSDIGLAGALIQKKDEPTREDLVTTFTIQQIMVGGTVIFALLLSPIIGQFYKLPAQGIFVFQALAISFFLSSLNTIPSILLERKLDFSKLVRPQIVETFVYYLVAIVLAVKGFGVASYGWAALARGIAGTITIYLLSPWKPGIAIKIDSAKKLLSYGIPFQLPSFLALIKDDLIILLLGRILPLSEIGLIGWARKIVELTMRQQIMDNVVRVTFPMYTRLQHDMQKFSKAIQKTLLFLAMISFPVATGLILLISKLLYIIPNYLKWQPALFSFYLLTIAFVMATFSTPFYNALNALGRVKTTFKLMVFWTVLTWLTVPLFIKLFGFNGFAVASVLINFTSGIPLILLRRQVSFSFWSQISKPALATLVMAAAVIVVTRLSPTPQIALISGVITGLITYGTLTYFLLGQEVITYLKVVLHQRKTI